MPVTKCEPETTRKASRKYAKTQETVLSALLAQTEEVSVPLASLIKSPLNVRTVPYSAESVSELADSIKGVGLLQNLVVHALPGDRYGVAAGGRRLAALNMLAERNILPADWPVRVKVIPQEGAGDCRIDDRERSASGYAPCRTDCRIPRNGAGRQNTCTNR